MIYKQTLLSFASFLLMLLIAFGGCDHSTNYYTPGERYYELLVTSIDSIAIDRDEVVCAVTVQLPSPCYQYHHRNVIIGRNNINVNLFGTRLEGPCAQVITMEQLDIGFNKPQPGEYNLRFQGPDTSSVDTTIVIEKRGARRNR